MSDFLLKLVVNAAEECLTLATVPSGSPQTKPQRFTAPIRTSGPGGLEQSARQFHKDFDLLMERYREPGAAFLRGYTLREYICQLYGNAGDPVKGRQMPVHHSVRRINYVSISSPVGTQIPQATGMAMAATQIATGAAALAWMFTEWMIAKKPSVLGMISGAVAGLVAITPA